MARYFARIIRAIIVSVLGFGGGVALMTFIALVLYSNQQTAITVSLRMGLILGAAFGLVISLVMVLSDLTMRLRASQGQYDEIWELEQTREITFNGNLKDLKQHSREALLAVPNLKSVSEDQGDMTMTAAIGGSWRSPGEEMQLSISAQGEGQWKVKCVSRCLQKNIAFDYGKNFENVESWLTKTNHLIAPKTSST